MSHQSQLSLFDEGLSAEALLSAREGQWFERKSFKVTAKALADTMVGFANSDGGRIAIGIHSGDIEGIDSDPRHLNDLLQASLDFTQPPIRHRFDFLTVGDSLRVLVIDVEASETIHRNQKHECFLRVGDENRKLGHTEERELAFDKGESQYDASLVPESGLQALDADSLREYSKKIGAKDLNALMRSRHLWVHKSDKEGPSQAGLLLFGKNPPLWSYIRYTRYLGSTIETGVRSNSVDDVTLYGTIPELIEQAKILLSDKLGVVSRLAWNGKFETRPVLPEFAWLEAVVNAVTHRSYSLQGDGVRVRDFENRLEVESPGRLAGLVRVKNIRETRYSRNPHIARVLAEMSGYVRELNEGVPRMYEEMKLFGLQEPRFTISDGSVTVTLMKTVEEAATQSNDQFIDFFTALGFKGSGEKIDQLAGAMRRGLPLKTSQIAELLEISVPTARRYLKQLMRLGLVEQVKKSATDPTGYWSPTKHQIWRNETS